MPSTAVIRRDEGLDVGYSYCSIRRGHLTHSDINTAHVADKYVFVTNCTPPRTEDVDRARASLSFEHFAPYVVQCSHILLSVF